MGFYEEQGDSARFAERSCQPDQGSSLWRVTFGFYPLPNVAYIIGAYCWENKKAERKGEDRPQV